MTAPATAAPGPAAPAQHSHLKHISLGAGIGGVTVAAGMVGARHFTSNAGHVQKLVAAGKLVHEGPKVHGVAHPAVKRIATMAAGRREKLTALVNNPEAMRHLHADLGSRTPSTHALHISRQIHPNGYTNPTIAHSRKQTNVDLLHDPLSRDKDLRVHATKTMLHHADPAHSPDLHRGMRGVEHHPGDVVDFGHFSSFTSTRPIAEAYAHQHAHPHVGVYRLPKGSAKAVPVDGTGWTSRNHEWLAGGKYKITGKRSVQVKGKTVHHYDLEPHTEDVAKAMGWTAGQKNTNAYHWLRDGMKVGAKRVKVSGATRAGYDAGIKTLAGQMAKPSHGHAFRAGVKLADYGTRPAVLGTAGAATIGATALAVHHNNRQPKQKVAAVAKSAFGVDEVVKAYSPGTITYHQQQADLHGRKRRAARNLAAGGAAVGTAGLAAEHNAPHVARWITEHNPSVHPDHARFVAPQLVPKVRTAGRWAAVAGTTAGLAGVAGAVHHGRKQNKEAKAAQRGRRSRNAELEEKSVTKSAFGVPQSEMSKAFGRKKKPVANPLADSGEMNTEAGRRKALRTLREDERAATGVHDPGFTNAEIRRVSKSVFGVEELAKLGPPKVTYRQTNITRRNEKKNKTTHYGPTQISTERRGSTLILRRPKYRAHGSPQVPARANDLVGISPRRVVHHTDARRLASAHEKNSEIVTLSGGHTMKHTAIGKSAFGVEHEIEKFALGGVLDAGRDALKGVKAGLGGKAPALGGVVNQASAAGKGLGAGSALRSGAFKLKPLVSTPGRAAATAGVTGVTGGALLGSKKNN